MTMTDETVSTSVSTPVSGKGDGLSREVFPPELIDLLMDRVKTDGIQLLGDGGLISELSKRIFERALDEELTEELGYERGDPAGRGSGNSRNGTTPKTVITEVGSVDLDIPRDRNGTFEPKLIPKGVTRLKGFNENIICLYAGGMSVRDIRKTLKRFYGVDVSPDLISRVTDGVLDELAAWQARPADTVYPIMYIDGLVVKVRTNTARDLPVRVCGCRRRCRRPQARFGCVAR